jgi:hypothetical protein
MTSTGFNLKGGLWNRCGGGEGHLRCGRTWVAARVRFLGEIGMGMRGGGAPKLI